MDSTPTSHRPRRGRKVQEKCSSTPIRAILNNSPSNRTSPSISPMDRATTSWLTPSTDKYDIDGNEQLTRSALRRELLIEDEDDYIMPCTQIVDPSANGAVYWNYNASPATARARAALKERLSQLEDSSVKEDKRNPCQPSPVLRIPMCPVRKKPPSTSTEEAYVKEQQNKKEVNAMLNSMKEIFQAELQKHQDPKINNENGNIVEATPEAKNNSFGKDGLVSDDDSFILRATQVIGDSSEHREKCNQDNQPKVHISHHDNKDQRGVHSGEAFDDDDEFDFMLSQMEMPHTEPLGPSKSEKITFSHNSVKRNVQLEKHDWSRNGTIIKGGSDTTSDKPYCNSNSTTQDIKLPSCPDKLTNPKIAQESKNLLPSGSNSYFKRFKSASGVSNIQQNINESKDKKTSTFGRRSYSTPDAASHNQLPGGRDMSVKLSNAENKPKCSSEEIERKRLEAVKKREIERKRQEAIKRRQLNSQKLQTKP